MAGVGAAEMAVGPAADVDVAGSVHGDSIAGLPRVRANLRRPDFIAVRAELAQEGIAAPAVMAGVRPTEVTLGPPLI